MQIYLNGTEKSVSASKLETILLEQNFLSKKGIAVAVNNQVVPKSSWSQFTLKDHDKVLIIQASQGG